MRNLQYAITPWGKLGDCYGVLFFAFRGVWEDVGGWIHLVKAWSGTLSKYLNKPYKPIIHIVTQAVPSVYLLIQSP